MPKVKRELSEDLRPVERSVQRQSNAAQLRHLLQPPDEILGRQARFANPRGAYERHESTAPQRLRKCFALFGSSDEGITRKAEITA